MTHFNHDWDTTVTPAIPVATGDRYYAQDLNDDFNYLKHLPCEFALQGKTKGVIIPPTETWDGSVLALTGGVGAIVLDTTTLDVDESFTVPPKTTTAQRYERIAFTDASLTVPDDGNIYYIVATVTKRSLLQRAKALLSEQYASRIRYDGVLELQTTAPTDNQILVGLCSRREYLLCIDSYQNIKEDVIVCHKWRSWFNTFNNGYFALLQSYYNTQADKLTTHMIMDRGYYDASLWQNGITVNMVNSTIDVDFTNIDNLPQSTEFAFAPRAALFNTSTFDHCHINIPYWRNRVSIFEVSSSSYYNKLKDCELIIGNVLSVYSQQNIFIDQVKFYNCNIEIQHSTVRQVHQCYFYNCNVLARQYLTSDVYHIFYTCMFYFCIVEVEAEPLGNPQQTYAFFKYGRFYFTVIQAWRVDSNWLVLTISTKGHGIIDCSQNTIQNNFTYCCGLTVYGSGTSYDTTARNYVKGKGLVVMGDSPLTIMPY